MITCKIWGDISLLPFDDLQFKTSKYSPTEEGKQHILDNPPALFIISIDQDPSLETIVEFAAHIKGGALIVHGNASADQTKRLLNSGVFALTSSDDELHSALIRAYDHSEALRKIQRENNLLRAKIERSTSLLREKFVEDMLFGSNLSSIDIQRQLAYFNIKLQNFALLAIELDPLANLGHTLNEDDVNTLIFIVIDQIETLLEYRETESIVCVRSKRIYTIIPTSDSESQTRQNLISFADELSETMEKFGRFTVSVGISRVHSGIAQLRVAREEGDRCLAARFHLGDNCVLHIDELPPKPQELTSTVDIEMLKRSVANGASVIDEAHKLARLFSEAGNPDQIKNIAIEAITAAVLAYCEAFGSVQDIFPAGSLPLDRVLRAATVEAVSGELIDVAARIQAAITKKLSTNAGRAIESAKAYIEAHYSDEITLADVASSIHMSQWYFSKLFRKETGTTFSDYLIDLRIRRAKELIRKDSAMKNYEIAERVGFSDSRYFGQLFKKTTGMTPGEYRRMPTETPSSQDIASPTATKKQPQIIEKSKEQNDSADMISVQSGIADEQNHEQNQKYTAAADIAPQSDGEVSRANGMYELDDIAAAVESGRSREARQLARLLQSEGADAQDIINVMIKAMDRVGERFRIQEIFVPEMLMSARAMSVVLETLQPQLGKTKRTFEGKILIGTVVGDLHDIGKNLVAMMLRGSGFNVIDLGVNVSEDDFIEAIRKHKPDIVGLSALLTSTVNSIGSTIASINSAGLRNNIAIMIGGAPLDEASVEHYGADGYSEDAPTAVELARRLMKRKH